MADATPKAILSDAGDLLFEWGIPLAGLAAGYFAGDMLGLHNIIFGLDKDGALGKAVQYRVNPYRLLAGLFWLFIALLLWRWVDAGWIGKTVGLFFAAIGLRQILDGARNVP